MLVEVCGREPQVGVGIYQDLVGFLAGAHGEALDLGEARGLDLRYDPGDLGRCGLLTIAVPVVAAGREAHEGQDRCQENDSRPHVARVLSVVTYTPNLDDLRRSIDDELTRFLTGIGNELEQSEPLLAEISLLLNAGGKRLRPAFCYWGSRAAGAAHSEALLRVAASLELLHTFALVHDDIMDASDERRGVRTVHVRLGIGTALLVGDLALVLADDLFMASGFDAASLREAFASYSRMRKQVIVGQHMELTLADRTRVEEAEARLVARMKSGRYSIKEPLLIGGCLGPRAGEITPGLSEYGELLGEAFQIRDDLLGTFGRRPETGKPVDSDIREGKKNVLFARTLQRLDDADRDFFLGRWGAGVDLADTDIETIRDLIESSGGRAATEELLEDLRGRALEALADLILDEEPRAALEDLAEEVTRRSA